MISYFLVSEYYYVDLEIGLEFSDCLFLIMNVFAGNLEY